MNKTGKVVIGSVVAAAVIGGGVLTYSLVGGADIDLATAAPSSSVSYVEIDLDPSINQKIASLSLSKKIASISGEKDIENKSLSESLTEKDFPGLDFEKDIKPFLGDKTANVSFNGDFDNVTIYETKNKKLAQENINKMSTQDKVYQVEDKWIVVAKDKATLSAYNDSMGKDDKLNSSDVFVKDRKAMGDNVAFAWIDLEKIETGEDSKLNNLTNSEVADSALIGPTAESVAPPAPTTPEIPEISGRATAALSLSDNSVNIDVKTFDIKVDGEAQEYTSETGAALLPNLSESVVGGFEIVDMSNSIKNNWEQVEKAAGADKEALEEQVNSISEMIGVKIPDEIDKILGNNTSLSYNDNETVELQADGADSEAWENIYSMVQGMTGSSYEYTDVPQAEYGELSTDGSIQKFMTTSPNDKKLSENKIGDSKAFKDALPKLDKAQFAAYVDINKAIEVIGSSNEENKDVDEGVVGLTSSFDKDKNEGDMTIRWVIR